MNLKWNGKNPAKKKRGLTRGILRHTQVHVCADLTLLHPHVSVFKSIHESICISIHPLSNRPFIRYPAIHSFMQSTSLSSQPTHTPLIQWLTLHRLDQYSLKWHHCKHLGTMASCLFVQSISKVPRPYRPLTHMSSPFPTAYMITAKSREGAQKKVKKGEKKRKKGIEQWASCRHTTIGAVAHAQLPVMTQDYWIL